MNNKINKKQLLKMRKHFDEYVDFIDKTSKLDKTIKEKIMSNMLEKESRDSVIIEHTICPREC